VALPPLMLALLTGCAAPRTDDTATGGDTGASDALPAAWTEYYRVESHIEAAGFEFDESYWARRVVDPAAATIDERFVEVTEGVVTQTDIVVDADAGTFSLDINDGEYTGAGTLHGAAWAWTSWESRSETSDGSYVLSEDTVTATGLRADKVGYSAEGEAEWTLTETLTSVDEAEWQAGMDALP
jgi:hypothetical protein